MLSALVRRFSSFSLSDFLVGRWLARWLGKWIAGGFYVPGTAGLSGLFHIFMAKVDLLCPMGRVRYVTSIEGGGKCAEGD